MHAAGNDAKDNDIVKNYPTKYYTDSLEAVLGEASNWITVGATSSLVNDEMKRKGEALGADAQLSKPEIGNLVRVIDDLVKNK